MPSAYELEQLEQHRETLSPENKTNKQESKQANKPKVPKLKQTPRAVDVTQYYSMHEVPDLMPSATEKKKQDLNPSVRI